MTGHRRRAGARLFALCALVSTAACATATTAGTGTPVDTAQQRAIGLTPGGLRPTTPEESTSLPPPTQTRPPEVPTTPARRPVTTAPAATLPAATDGSPTTGTTTPAVAVPTVVLPPPPTPTVALSIPRVVDPVVHPDAFGSTGTACTTVFHIGDSLTVGTLTNVPSAQRQDAQYARVGVTYPRIDALGGRTIKEFRIGVSTAVEAASKIREQSGHGCWVFAVGTNDAANISIGSDVKARERIDRMMAIAGTDPVMWVNTVTRTDYGPWASVNMQLWNLALLDAASDYPTMRIFDWESEVNDEWFLTDGIHHDAIGYASRARLIADALATAFPG